MMNFDLEPVSWSRNWDEEEFDAPLPLNPPEFKWNQNVTLPLKTTRLLIGAKGAGASFLECYLPPTQLLATVTIPIENPDTKLPKNAPTCKVYSVDSETVVVACHYEVEPDIAFIWAKTLLTNIVAQQIFVFDTLLASFYRTPNRPSQPFLRKLQTSATKTPFDVPFLESPNMIERISAAIISYCEVRQIPAVVFVSLQESLFVSATTLSAFEKVLNSAPLSLTPPPNLSKSYLRTTEHFNVSSDTGLYI